MRVKPYEATEISGAEDIRSNEKFETDFRALANSGNYGHLYLDLFRINAKDIDRPAPEISELCTAAGAVLYYWQCQCVGKRTETD